MEVSAFSEFGVRKSINNRHPVRKTSIGFKRSMFPAVAMTMKNTMEKTYTNCTSWCSQTAFMEAHLTLPGVNRPVPFHQQPKVMNGDQQSSKPDHHQHLHTFTTSIYHPFTNHCPMPAW